MAVMTVENPLRAGMRLERTPDPCTMVIFGATGDLTRRKLMPALYSLWREHLLPGGFSVIGFSRTPMSDDQFREDMKSAVKEFGNDGQVETAEWDSFAEGLFYIPALADRPDEYHHLATLLDDVDKRRGTGGNRLFYLAIPPSSVLTVVDSLQKAGLSEPEKGWARIIVEKPFGNDLESARQLNAEITRVFREDQIYRIDHYLGKETVQNLLVFRFGNGIFEPIWNRRYVDYVQITAAETVGVENRASYYEEAGALRDMVQNHMLQLLAITAMEPPTAIAAAEVRTEKTKVFRSIPPVTGDRVNACVVRGQYGPGWIEGKKVPGYRDEPGVKTKSNTETYVALKLSIENWRWAGVPFYLRAGKRLPKQVTEIAIQFKQAPLLLFNRTPVDQIAPNLLLMHIQPDEGISLRFVAKQPGPAVHLRTVNMDFRYATSFGVTSASAYERLLLDCMLGDATLFADREGVEDAWAIVTPILRAWESQPPPAFPNYDAGTWGPSEADKLMKGDKSAWRRP